MRCALAAALPIATALRAAPWAKKAAPPQPPPSAVDQLVAAALELAWDGLTRVPWYAMWGCAAFGLLSLASYLVPLILANLRGYNDLKRRYRAEWACVTGGSSGIGKELAIALAKQGISVVLVALDDDFLKATTAGLVAQFPDLQFRAVGVNLAAADGSVYMKKIAKVVLFEINTLGLTRWSLTKTTPF